MRGIGEQFYTELTLASWIEESFDVIKSLKDKIPFVANHEDFEGASDFWTMGPKKSEPGKYFIYWHTKMAGSTEREIISISVVPDSPYIMVFCSHLEWHKFDRNKAAISWAKTLDLFLCGAYTDIPPLALHDIIEHLRT